MNTQNVQIETGFWESFFGMFVVSPLYLIGALLVGILAIAVIKKCNLSYQITVLIASLILFYYMSLTFENVFGTPQLSQIIRFSERGDPFFHPNINVIPFVDGISLPYILNIIVFMPIGFLSPIISKTYRKLKYAALFGFCVSLLIEVSQLFVPFRSTDIDDLSANTLGMIVGCLIFKAVKKITKDRFSNQLDERQPNTWLLPILIVIIAFINTFFTQDVYF